jgi:spore maturation protein CgeB
VSLFSENLKLLRGHDPALARRVERVSRLDTVQVMASKDGNPIPRVGSVTLHSTYRPKEEAARAVSEFVYRGGFQNVVYGLGFGYHVEEMLNRYFSGEVTIIEPSLEIFHAFVSSVDLKPFLPRTHFLIGEPTPKILARFKPEKWNILYHLPSVRASQDYFNRLEKGRDLAGFIKSNSLRILVVNPIYGGSLPTAQYCARALENLGHQVASVECDKFADGFLSLEGVTSNKPNAQALSNMFMNMMGEMTAAKAVDFQPDLILALAQAPLTPDAIQKLKLLNIPVAFWFVEDFRTLPYWKEVAASYDHFFTIQQGEFFEQLQSHGAKRIYYLSQGCFPDVHRTQELAPEERKTYGADLSFMGAAYYNRRKTFPQLLDHDFKIWGTGWELESSIGQRVQNENRRVSSEETVKIYNGAKIHLNLHSSTFHESINPEGDFVNPRTFEIPACGGFQLVDERSELKDLFRAGEEIITFENVADLREKINYYLEHEEERESIARKGHKRALSEHTMEHRMTELLIHIFGDQVEILKQRMADRKEPLDVLIEQAGRNSELAEFLEPFRGTREFSLKTVIAHIAKGEGALTKPETLMLMVNQLVNEER